MDAGGAIARREEPHRRENASGKSRVLNVINALARNLAGLQPPGLSADYDVAFTQDGKALRYQLEYEEEQVVAETFSIEDRVLLSRERGGEGTIWAEEIDGGRKFASRLHQAIWRPSSDGMRSSTRF